MTAVQEQLQEVSLDLVPNLWEVLKSDPEALLHCQILDLYVKCKEKIPERDIRLFVPNGKIDQFGTNVLFVPEHRYTIFFHTMDPDHDRLKRLLLGLKNIVWDIGPVIGPFSNRFNPTIEDIVNELKLTFGPIVPSNNYILGKNESNNLDISTPASTELRPLTLDHADFVNDRWPHKSSVSLQLIKDTIVTTGGYGLFNQETGELLSWALHAIYGGVGMMQTAPQHRGKGYGAIVGRAITKKIGEEVEQPQVQIKLGLEISVKLFTAMGFKFTHLVRWTHIEPKNNQTQI